MAKAGFNASEKRELIKIDACVFKLNAEITTAENKKKEYIGLAASFLKLVTGIEKETSIKAAEPKAAEALACKSEESSLNESDK